VLNVTANPLWFTRTIQWLNQGCGRRLASGALRWCCVRVTGTGWRIWPGCQARAAHRRGQLRRAQAPAVKAWLAGNPRITLHFTLTSCSWLNMVEIFFGIITRQAIRRGTFRSVKDLTTAIGACIDAYNDRCTPFAWTKDADVLLAKIRPSKD